MCAFFSLSFEQRQSNEFQEIVWNVNNVTIDEKIGKNNHYIIGYNESKQNNIWSDFRTQNNSNWLEIYYNSLI